VTFADLDASDGWAKTAIQYVAGSYDWMRDFAPEADGSYPFPPDAYETKRYFARAVVLAFAPDAVPDPSIVFTDLDPSSSWYRYAAVAVDRGWIRRRADGAFLPDEPVTMTQVHRARVQALGLRKAARGLDAVTTASGQTFDTPRDFGTTVLGMRLFLRYNAPSGSESMDVGPRDRLTRAQVAFSLYRAATQPSYNIDDLMTQYTTVTLPHLGPKAYDLVQWGVRYAGYPYVWGGEWGLESQEPSALGSQPRSGFDCSGLTWWIVKRNDGAWQVNPPRPYAGWSLLQRTSADMARMTPDRLSFGQLKPGDILFYDGDGDGTTDHVDTYIGNGYALDSSSTPGGVSIMWVGDGWYREHFQWGRRIFG
jgi:cell wall-associated NlpC family hydrolase